MTWGRSFLFSFLQLYDVSSLQRLSERAFTFLGDWRIPSDEKCEMDEMYDIVAS